MFRQLLKIQMGLYHSFSAAKSYRLIKLWKDINIESKGNLQVILNFVKKNQSFSEGGGGIGLIN